MKKPVVKVEFGEDSTKDAKNKSRRRFIKIGGLAFAGSSFLMYSCSGDDLFDPGRPQTGNPAPEPEPEPEPEPTAFDLGSGDLGILNYDYALEQLEAAFYTAVRGGAYYAGASAEEKEIMDDLYNHEVIHREFFRLAITAAAGEGNEALVLPDLEFDLSSVDLGDRTAVLTTAQTLEDTGVGAYNGAGNRIENATYLLLAGKIVSVEARHAAAIRDILNEDDPTAFAGDDIIDEDGLDIVLTPEEVIERADPFITTEFTANELPQPMTGA